MNQELTQRLIGAVVVTALAAIFIPMLFDDPVDNSGQVVSELVIPEQPAVVDTPPPVPSSVEDVTPAPENTATATDSASENTDTGSALSSQELSAEPEDSVATPSEEQEFSQPTEEAAVDNVDEPVQALDADDEAAVEKPVKKAPAPVVNTVSPVEKIVKKPAVAPIKPAPAVVKPVTVTPAKPAAKTVKPTPELVRWYIQAGSFSKKENAASLADNLRKQGMPVLLETIQVAGKGTLYRLKVGPELDKKRAAAMKEKLDQQNISNMLIAE